MREKVVQPGIFPGRLSCLMAMVSLWLTSCAIGPDFTSPTLSPDAGYQPAENTLQQTPAISPKEAGHAGATQTLRQDKDLPADWWTLFRSPTLDALIHEALQHSPTLAAAEAALRQARENYQADLGSLLAPTIEGQANATRSHQFQGVPPAHNFTVYSAGLTVSYEIDVLGGGRRELEGLAAQVDYQRYQREAARQTLIFNVVNTAVQQAAARIQLAATRRVESAQTSQLAIITQQHRLGAVPLATVLTQQQQLAQTRASLSELEKTQTRYRNQLSIYLGRYPNDPNIPAVDLTSLKLPNDLPLSLPSALVRQRPDIQASEALLHQASAQVGVATANLYPQLTLSGSYARQRMEIGGGHSYASLWNLGAGLVMPLINGGTLRAKRRAAIAAYDQAAAQYRQTVLSAFQNVADTLHTIEADAGVLEAQAKLAEDAHRLRDIAQQRYRLGAISYLTVLDAESAYQQARVNLATRQAVRFSDTAMLYMALGGGWWNRTAHAQSSDSPKVASSGHDNHNIQ